MNISNFVKLEGMILAKKIKIEKNLLILLLLADLTFILFDVIIHINRLKVTELSKYLFYIASDMSYAEFYQYTKEYWILFLLVIIASRKKQNIYYAWAFLFTYLLLDDSLQIHENFGIFFANFFNLKPLFGLRSQDFGELITVLLFGIIIFSFIGILYFQCDTKAKEVSKILLSMVFLLTLFGVLIDMVHVLIQTPYLNGIFGLIEDGGEMIVMSIILGYVYNLSLNKV